MSLLEYDTTRKKRVDKTTTQLEFEVGDNGKEYKVDAIWVSAVYTRKSEGHLPSLYYLVLWKSYQENEKILEFASAMQHFQKLISTFYKDFSEKLTAASTLVSTVLPMARSTIRPQP